MKKSKQNTRILSISAALIVIALVIVVSIILSNASAATQPTDAAASAASTTPEAGMNLGALTQLDQITAAPTPTPSLGEIMAFFADDDPYHGPDDAPVVIVEFSDYLCPYCGNFYLETLPQILEAYPDTVKFVHRDAPVLDQNASLRASIAAGCADDQGKFWEMHNRLFGLYEGIDLDAIHEAKVSGDTGMWQEHVNNFTAEALRAMAAEIGLDLDAYDACMVDDVRSTEVVIDLQTAMQLGIQGVPAYIVNGQLIGGARPFSDFSNIIDSTLAQRPITG